MTPTDAREGDEGGHQPPYRLLAEMASDVAMQISADSRVVWISPAIEEVLGWSVDEIVGTSIFDRMHPEDIARGQRARDDVMSGNVVRNDLRFLTKDGTWRWMSARLAPVHDEQGRVIGRVAGWHDVSAEYALRDELREREEQFRTLAENASDIVVRVDADGLLQWVSPSVRSMLGWASDELVGRHATDVVHAPDLDAADAAASFTTSDRPFHFEARLACKDGGMRWMAVAVRPVFDEHGETVAGRVVGLRDIEAEVRARDELAASEERFRFLVENANDVVLLQVEGRVVFVSPAVQRLLGWSPEDLIGRDVAGLWYRDDQHAAAALHSTSLRADSSNVMRMSHRDGSVRWIEISASPVTQPDGRAGAVSILRDVTETVLAERTLARIQARDAVLARMSSDVYLILDRDATIRWASGASEALFGLSNAELVGVDLVTAVLGDGVPDFRRRLDAGEMVAGVIQVRTANRPPRWIDFRALHDSHLPEPDAWAFVSIRDAQAEMDIRAALEVSERQAQEASSAKTMFLSRMSHELRTPLNAVLGFAQLLQLQPLAPAQVETVDKIITGGRHLLDLINEVLDITRIEAGRMALTVEDVAVADVVTEAIDLVRGLAATVDIEVLPFDAAACDDLVRADRQRVVQVLLNLLSNAVKYHRPSGTVRVRCIHTVDGMIGVEVEDDGPGIAPELLGRLFQPFDRLGAERTNIEGTGMGLAVSRGLAETMGGRLEVRSTVGVGSVFTLLLPHA